MKNLLVCVSGGRSSAMMAYHISQSAKYKDFNIVYHFCNTSSERPETITFLKSMVEHWGLNIHLVEGVYSNVLGVGVRHRVTTFSELKMDNSVFENMIASVNKGTYNGLPHSDAPFCSSHLKNRVSSSFAKEIFNGEKYIKAVGFRSEDMPKRISWPEIKNDKTRIFPLLTDFASPINQHDLNCFFGSQPFRLSIHNVFGNCSLCWKKSDLQIISNIRAGSSMTEFWRAMENKYNSSAFRGKKSIEYYVQIAQSSSILNFDFDGGSTDGCICNF